MMIMKWNWKDEANGEKSGDGDDANKKDGEYNAILNEFDLIDIKKTMMMITITTIKAITNNR